MRPIVSLIALAALAALVPSAPAQAQSVEAISSAIGDLEWRNIGPVNMGGRVSAIAGIPGDSRTFWVGGADGGVWRTTNGGTTFEPQWQEEEAYSVGALAVASSDPNVVWLGSGEGDPRNSVSYGLGVWRSTDGGSTWSHLGLEGTERIKRVVVHPKDPDVALVCALGREWGPNEERGVFKTTDGGANWTKVLYIDQDTGCSDLDIDFSNPRNIYAGMWTFRRRPWRFDGGGRETGVYISRDMGETWTKVETLPDEPMARIGLSVAQSSPNIVYLITEFPTAGTLFKSVDYGATWEMVNEDRNLLNFRPFYYSDVFVDPSNENILFTLSGALARSVDGGRTFDRIGQGVHGDHQSFWINPADGDHVLSGSDGGWQVSLDGGDTFHIQRNFSLAQYYHVFVDDRDPYWVCGGLQDNGNWCGPSRTRQQGIMADEWYTVSGGDGFYTVPVPGKPNLVYSNAQGGYFRITDTNSGVTRNIEPYPRQVGSQGQGMFRARYRFNWDAPIVISPHDPGTVYWGGNVLFRSRDEGYTWDVISPDLTTDDPEKQRDSGGEIYNDNTAAEFHTTILTVAESPLEQGVIWVGTDDGNLQLSRDDGANWTNLRDAVPGLPAETWVGNIEASYFQPGGVFVAVDNHRLDDFTPHVYATDDYGQTWRDLSAGLPQDDYVKVVRQHPENENLLFVGMERGIFASWDGGQSWVDIRGNLPRVSVRGIRVQPQYNDLVIGTHGRGAFILDDIGPWIELADAMSGDVHLFDIRTATEWASWSRDSSLGQSTFTGTNPEPGAYIDFYLAEAPAAVADNDADNSDNGGNGASQEARRGGGADDDGPGVTVRITAADGELVREFEHRGAKEGVNRAVWDLRYDGAEPVPGAPAPTGFFARFVNMGPAAAPGTYTATLVIDGQEYSKDFQLRGDPAANVTQADYEARTAAGLRARELQSQLNQMVGTLQDIDGQIDNLLGSIEGKGLANEDAIKTTAGSAQEQIEDLEGDLTRPPGSMNYRDYPRLSEELGFVNRQMQFTQARPTDGQVEALTDIEQEAQVKAQELADLVNGIVVELNELLEDQPKIITGWERPVTVSMRR
jgi:photosystem II stability/assembly factor-like uncharacterized protein